MGAVGWVTWVLLWVWVSVTVPTPTHARLSYHPPGSDPLALLAGTLRTFQEHACDASTLSLSCPHNTTIDITVVRYGRPRHNQASVDLCPPLHYHSALDHKTVCSYSKEVDYNTLNLVVRLCQQQEQCSIDVEPETFATVDPCPRTRKYMEVAYKCRPAAFVNKMVCVPGEVSLDCPEDNRLAIFRVLFGRSLSGSYACPQPEGVPEEECQASYANEIVMAKCHGHQACHISATTEVFGDPCSTASQLYMKTVYTCVPKKILKSPSRDADDPDTTAAEDEEATKKGGYEEGSLRSPPALPAPHSPDDPPPHHTPSTAFYNPTITTKVTEKIGDGGFSSREGTTDPPPGRDMGEDGSGQYPQDDPPKLRPELINCTVTILAGSQNREIGFLTEWMQAVAFVKRNFEKFLLYLLLGACVGLVLFMAVVMSQLLYERRRARREAKMMHDPLTSVFAAADIDDIDGDLDLGVGLGSRGGSLGRSHSPPYHHHDPVSEVVRYNTICRGVSSGGGGLRRQDSDTNPRSLTRNNNSQLFYS